MSFKSFKTQLRQLRLKIGKWLLDRKLPQATPSFPPQKILFLRHDGKIGDYIVSSFIFREIKKHYPHIQIGVVCSHKNAYLFKENPYIDHYYLVKTKSILDYLQCGKLLKQENYDVVIDPTTTLRNRDLLFLRMISAKYYVGYQKQHYQLFDLNVEKADHFSKIYQQALAMVNIQIVDPSYDIPFHLTSNQNIKNFLSQHQLKNYIAINFFGAGSARKFSDQKIKLLLSELKLKTNTPLVLLTFPEVTEKLKDLTKSFDNLFIYENTQTVFDTIELVRYADLVISPDTAIVHIASGLNKKLIAFYSLDQENFIHWHPNNQAQTEVLFYKKSVNEIELNQLQQNWFDN